MEEKGRVRALATRLGPLVVIVCCLFLLSPLQAELLRMKEVSRLSATSPFEGKKPGEFVGTVLLSGFRNLAIDVAWMKAIKLNERREYYKLLAVYETIALLQPHLALVWQFNAHNMGWNIAEDALTESERERWVRRAIDFVKEGIRHNPNTYVLYDFLAFIYYFRVGRDERLKEAFLKAGENPYKEALRYWTLAAAQPDIRAPVFTSQVHCLIALWRFEEARRKCLELLRRWPEWEAGGVVYMNCFEDFKFAKSVPYKRNMRIYRTWKEME